MPDASPLAIRAGHAAGIAGWRRIPPAHSPLSLGNLLDSVVGGRGDPRQELAEVLSSQHAAEKTLLVDSGTHALQIAVSLAMTRSARPPVVALPAYSCFDVATAAIGAGARVVVYDVDPESLGPDPDSLRLAFECGALAAVIAPLYGMPVQWDLIDQSAAEYDALVIEDAAQGHGASWHGSPLGRHGSLSVLSFGRGKGWTGGIGGALLLRGDTLALLTSALADREAPPGPLATFARAAAQWALSRPLLYALPASLPWLHLGETRYRQPSVPREISRVAAGLLLGSRSASALEAQVRRANARVLDTAFESVSSVRRIRPVPGGQPGYLRYPVRVPRGFAGLADPARAARLGIASGYPASLAELPAVRNWLASVDRPTVCAGAEELVRTLITLPTHSLVTREELESGVALIAGSA